MTLRRFLSGVPALGDLERRVLTELWNSGEQDAQALHARLRQTRPIVIGTVQSTLERLVRKNLLARTKKGRAFIYSSAVTRQELTAQMVCELVQSLDGVAGAGSGVIDFSRPVNEATLQQLEEWIAGQRGGKQVGDG